jgi:hypothetical protein
MVQIVENLTTVRGRIEQIRPSSELDDYDVVTLHVDETVPVPEKADLLSWLAGQSADVLVRRELLGDAHPGDNLTFQASRTAPGTVMAEPHPGPGGFTIQRSGAAPS